MSICKRRRFSRQREAEIARLTEHHPEDDGMTMLAKLAYNASLDGDIDPHIRRHVELWEHPFDWKNQVKQ